MADKAIEPGKKSTERYLPEAAWKAMSKAERKKTDDKKKRERATLMDTSMQQLFFGTT